MKRSVLISLVVAASLALVAAGLILSKERTVGTVQVQNGSGERIELVTVQVSGNALEFKNLQPSEKQIESFRIGSDSSYKISARFASGKVVTGSCGYVTNGVESNDLITVLDNALHIGNAASAPPEKC